MIPDVLKWQKDRATWLNVLCIVAAILFLVVFAFFFVLSAFVSALFGLAGKS